MFRLVPHTSCPVGRLVATAVFAAVAMTSVVSMCSSSHAVFADAAALRIQSASIVGPLSGAALAPAVRMHAPDIEPAAGSAVIENRSTCRRDLTGSVMTITIPDISYSCPVYAGGQSMLDSGAVTQISDPSIASVLADHPGGPGVLWIAAHRSSHGGAFADVPSLADGSIVTVSDGTLTASYRIVGRLYATIENDRVLDGSNQPSGAATLDSIVRPDHGNYGASRLLLQTCDGDSHRWMIYADLVVG